MSDFVDDYERTLCQLPSCHVFKIPLRTSAEGYRAADWPKDHVWSGKVKIVAIGRKCIIRLIDDNNNIFAVCPVEGEGSVERTLDSGRYFVLRIQNDKGKHAFIGIAFNERNDAFDFNVALQEHKSEIEREDKAAQIGDVTSSIPMKDLSIKQGEKIKINITGTSQSRRERERKGATGGLLAPPPGSGLLPPPGASSGSRAASVSGPSTDPFASSSSSSSSSIASDPFALKPKPAPTTASLSVSSSMSDPFFSTPSPSSSVSPSVSVSSDPFSASTNSSDPFSLPAAKINAGFDAFSSSSASNTSTDPFAPSNNTFAKASTTAGTSSNASQVDAFGFPVSMSSTTARPTPTSTSSAVGESLLDFNY
mmetsp:Transcript_30353/g.30849  ORF Transcript_30353/g.30849 Transcript_30353/m.30849 type:complete len:366 (+) Transcript_30353:52-1149(+)|eukprot:CAMPEP_0182417644 /NCGR_PEP_ID=MMETSP1167-20130531/2093_1 /TAXON_ID=2988 /ORGANISM="Mallomonas Sp, Strain CCMP3275" /LENGTH=365 /DNA_ID=CAMNT_0024591345 /DNA_START=47 /DNA_END=1144 /DNA_ORIENTATION=-